MFWNIRRIHHSEKQKWNKIGDKKIWERKKGEKSDKNRRKEIKNIEKWIIFKKGGINEKNTVK